MATKGKKPPRLLSRAAIAAAFDVTPLRITKWTADGMPVVDRGARGRESRYDLRAVVSWYIERELQARGVVGDGEAIDLATERAQLARVHRTLATIKVEAEEKRLLPVEEVRRVVGGAFHAVRVRLLALGRTVAERCHVAASQGAAAVQVVIDDAVHEALSELAEAREMDGGSPEQREAA